MTGILLALALQLAPNPPSLRIFAPGPLLNLGTEQADVNAVAHLWFGAACPLAGYYVAGRKGLRIAAASCAALVLTRETFFHGRTPGPEARTDLLSGLLPLATAVLLDALVHP
jgi:hypothetical protein